MYYHLPIFCKPRLFNTDFEILATESRVIAKPTSEVAKLIILLLLLTYCFTFFGHDCMNLLKIIMHHDRICCLYIHTHFIYSICNNAKKNNALQSQFFWHCEDKVNSICHLYALPSSNSWNVIFVWHKFVWSQVS